MVRDFGSHPMMHRIQDALYKQLQREYERTTLEMREKETEVTAVNREREDVGVELYGTQQQLARLQMALEALHSQSHGLVKFRRKEEVKTEQAKATHASLAAAQDEKEKALLKNQAELDALNETLRQVERYNEEMKNEIAVTRRATYKAEENVAGLEKQKKNQDMYIDSLNEQVKKLGEQIAVHEGSVGGQRKETEEAHKMLAETQHEMELIAFEKKQLTQQWKSSLIQLTKRDEALAAAQRTLREAQMEARDHDTEIEGATREEQITKMRAERDALADQYNLLQRSMGQTDEEEKKVDGLAAQLKQQVDQIAQNIN